MKKIWVLFLVIGNFFQQNCFSMTMESLIENDLQKRRTRHQLTENLQKNEIEEFQKTIKIDPSMLDEPNEEGNYLLHEVVNLKKSLISDLLKLGANPNVANDAGFTPLMLLAVNSAHYSTAADQSFMFDTLNEFLVSDKCDYHLTKTRDGKTLLQLFIESGQCACASALLETNKICPNTRDLNGMTPLGAAILKKDPLLIRNLLQKGAHSDMAVTKDGETLLPTQLAARFATKEIARLCAPEKLEKSNSNLVKLKQTAASSLRNMSLFSSPGRRRPSSSPQRSGDFS